MKKNAIVFLGILAMLGLSSTQAKAGHGFVSVGVGLGFPGPVYYPRPWGYYDNYYYQPYPVYVTPSPVIVQPAPVIQTVPAAQPVYQTSAAPPVAANSPVQQMAHVNVEHSLQQLADPDENVRADSVMRLGRVKAQEAIDPLAATLAGDRSPMVRETAARALGLIGSPRALPALQHAAQADPDREVRHSAQFATDVVLSNRSQ